MASPHADLARSFRALLPDDLRRGAEMMDYLSGDPVAAARIGQTPHTIIHRQNKASVRYFAPAAGVAQRTPLFISMPLINT